MVIYLDIRLTKSIDMWVREYWTSRHLNPYTDFEDFLLSNGGSIRKIPNLYHSLP